MLQYILNLSAIWLISLAVFDIFLRRESYHEYNRFYLVITLVTGIFLPLFQYGGNIVYSIVNQPAQKVFAAKQYVQTAAVQISSETSVNWLLILWISGMTIAAGWLVADIIKLVVFYTSGKRSAADNWTIVETHKEHAPFSFLNILFVSSRKLYDANEWHMLLIHERQHSKLLHFADVALIQLSRVVFWFHPLVYIYHKRLSLVHEYQADDASGQAPQVYGKFLVEQMMLQRAPSVAHALSNAPVKNRIKMLTHRSPRYRQAAKLLIFPLIAVFIICFTRYDIDYQVTGNSPAPREYSATELNRGNFTPSFPAAQSTSGNFIPVQQGKQTESTKGGRMMQHAIVYHTNENTGSRYDAVAIQLAGMENNANAKCCSSNLLWGNNYSGAVLTNCYPDKEPFFLSEYTANACTQGFDRSRKDQYTYAMESYRLMQESWNDGVPDNNPVMGFAVNRPAQIIIADDPWSAKTEKSPGMVPPLSLDRSMFGPNSRTIYDDAVAIAVHKEKPDGASTHDRFSIYPAGSDNRPQMRVPKNGANAYKSGTFTP